MTKLNSMDMVRVWAAMTGLFLVVLYFGMVWLQLDLSQTQTVAMLATAIGGFEIFFFGQDQWLKRRNKHG